MKNRSRPAYELMMLRFDTLIYREILRLRSTYQLSMDEFRGLYISDEQVDDLIRQHPGLGQVDIQKVSRNAAGLTEPARRQLAEDKHWSRLLQAYDLSDIEQDILILAFLPEIHAKYSVLYAYLNNDITRKYPTIELALNLLGESDSAAVRRCFATGASLRRDGLIKLLNGQNDVYALHSGFVPAPVLREFLLGHDPLDTHSATLCELSPVEPVDLESLPFNSKLIGQFTEYAELMRNPGIARTPFIVVESEPGNGSEVLVRSALSQAGLGCCEVGLPELLRERDAFDEQLDSLLHTVSLGAYGLMINDFVVPPEQEAVQRVLVRRLLARLEAATTPTLLLVHPRNRWWELLQGQRQLNCRIEAPGVTLRTRIWRFHLQDCELLCNESDLFAVADYFNLGYTQIGAAVNELKLQRWRHRSQELVGMESLFAVARAQSHADIGELAEQVRKDYRKDDLVLPGAILARLDELISAVRSRRLVFEQWGLQRRMGGSSGIVALFAGSSGTGKTMTASVIAREIGLDLYRIELSGVVSKYIGETEKNLDRIFAAAHRANCILFFDEADALFGKRSEVKDAHDRYANIEVAYLLQKIENHSGIVILTTNLAKSIDQAFMRRMHFVIEFPRPDVMLREQLWRGMFGESVPLAEDVDFNFLARQLDNTGGDIKNMVLDAALMAAASEQQRIDMKLLVRAAARQMMKQGKAPSAVEFKHYFRLVDERCARV